MSGLSTPNLLSPTGSIGGSIGTPYTSGDSSPASPTPQVLGANRAPVVPTMVPVVRIEDEAGDVDMSVDPGDQESKTGNQGVHVQKSRGKVVDFTVEDDEKPKAGTVDIIFYT